VFTADLLDHLEDTLCIDTTRIYATGKSNGGGFVNYLACHPISTRFAAFAPVAGAFYEGFGANGPACQPARSPQPILEIHGYNDSLISYFGDPSHHGGALPKITDWASDWAIRNGCSDGEGPSATPEVDGKVIYYSYPCDTYHYAVYGADHVWESTIGNADTERYEYGPSPINATSKIIDFFNKIQLPSNLARNLQSAQPSSFRDL
jgi:poly(3-hydroxybutyrate) depolymerase